MDAFTTVLDTIGSAFHLVSPLTRVSIGSGTNNRVVGLRSGNGQFICKEYQPIHSIEAVCFEHQVLRWLVRGELPFAVPEPLRAQDGDTVYKADSSLYALFPLIPGQRPDLDDRRQVEAIGRGLALLHRTLASCPLSRQGGTVSYGELSAIHEQIPDPFGLTTSHLGLPAVEPFISLLAWWRDELAALRLFVEGDYCSLPRQLIHGDYGPSNTLFENQTLVGIIDFEYVGVDVRAMDLASGLVFTMRIWEDHDPWPRAEALLGGYLSVLPMAVGERNALPWLIRLRNSVSEIFWLGKSLATGSAEEKVLRIGELQHQNRWLAEHGRRLVDLLDRWE